MDEARGEGCFERAATASGCASPLDAVSTPGRHTGGWRAPAAVFLAALVIHLCGTWALPLLDRDEARFAEASREMLQRHDLLIPSFNGEVRFDKPPLAYWCQISAYRLLGENEFAARLHSPVTAALAALVVYGFGKRLFGRWAALLAATIFTLSLQVLVLAKAAVADMPMILAFAVATWAGWELMQPAADCDAAPGARPGGGRRVTFTWWWVFYLALAIGFLAKGPVAWLPLVAAILFGVIERRAGLLRRLDLQWGAPLTLLIVSLWAAPAVIQTHGDFLRLGLGRHVFTRAVAPMEGHGLGGWAGYVGSLPFYFGTVFVSFFPWSLYLPRMFGFFRVGSNLGTPERYLLCSIAVVFAVFTFMATKLPHYILPAFPALALLAARCITARAPLGLRLFRSLAGGMMAADLVLGLTVFPLLGPLFPSRTLALHSRGVLHPGMRFASVGDWEPSLLWYFRPYMARDMITIEPGQARDYLARPGPRACVLPFAVALEQGIVDHNRKPDGGTNRVAGAAGWQTFRAHGWNVARGKQTDLLLIVKP